MKDTVKNPPAQHASFTIGHFRVGSRERGTASLLDNLARALSGATSPSS
jgi:hypothetical protein